ncbi:hypothetical protein [Caniella muris]|uniref:hypothetical protein n=1 Tax=Caniella muris TaxID=2941502 RepID=UPI0020415A58|nr:hypothetical protein [Caniella muris]
MADTVTICIPEGETLDVNDNPVVDNDLVWEWIENQRNKSLSIRMVLALYIKEHGTGDVRPPRTSRRRRALKEHTQEAREQATPVTEPAPEAPSTPPKAASPQPAGQTLDASDINRLLDFS